MSHVETDRELLDSIRRGDPGALEEFMRRYGGRISAFGMLVCGEREDAKHERFNCYGPLARIMRASTSWRDSYCRRAAPQCWPR